jgi:hypothetical protein
MNLSLFAPLLVAVISLAPAFVVETYAADPEHGDEAWTSQFRVEPKDFSSVGQNPFFILEPGYQLVLEGDEGRLTITVLAETKMVDGVETRIVEERETNGDKIIEVSRNFFAISKRTNGVYYFGEEVDDYKDGKLVGHGGAWLSGKDGAKFGLIMPGEALVGARHYQELAPKVAMDRAEIVSVTATLKTPAGEFDNCLKTEETTPLEPDEKEYKFYAAGVGLLQDGSLKLAKYGIVKFQ